MYHTDIRRLRTFVLPVQEDLFYCADLERIIDIDQIYYDHVLMARGYSYTTHIQTPWWAVGMTINTHNRHTHAYL